jgi:hypothetical protein
LIDLSELDPDADVAKIVPIIMKTGTPDQKRYLADFSSISPDQQKQLLDAAEMQEYYLDNFQFDINNKHYLDNSETGFYYEATYPLKQDFDIDDAGVTISARVTFQGGNSSNNIVFKRGKAEQIVTCVHTAVCNLPPERLAEMLKTYEENPGEFAIPIEEQSIRLPPEEHFVALKSYVDGIAQTGIANMLNASYYSSKLNPQTLPYGFNSAMQKQILAALKSLAPEATKSLIANHIIRLFEEVPSDWLESRIMFLDEIYNFKEIFLQNFETFESIYATSPSKIWLEWALTYPYTQDGILAYIATGGKEHIWDHLFSEAYLGPVMANILPLREGPGNRIYGRRWEAVAAILVNFSISLDFRMFMLLNAEWFVEQEAAEEGEETFSEFTQLLSKSEIPPAIVEKLLAPMSQSWEKLIEDNLRDRLFSQDSQIQLAAFTSPLLCAQVFEKIGKDALRMVGKGTRISILLRPTSPYWALIELARDPDEDIQVAVLSNPQLPVDLGKDLVRAASRRVKLGLYYRASRPAWLLEWLARDNDEEVQYTALTDLYLPTQTGSEIFTSASKRVKFAVLASPNRPTWAISQLIRDPDEEVQLAALVELQFPSEFDKLVVRNGRKSLKLSLLALINRPRWIIELLTQDPDQEVQISAWLRMPK